MRYSFVATDPVDFSRALRLEMGLEPVMREFEPVMVTAMPALHDGRLRELEDIVFAAGDPAVVQMLDVPHRMHEPARMMILLPDRGVLFRIVDLTLWAGRDPKTPLLVISPEVGVAFSATAHGLRRQSTIPLGIEASVRPGIERAWQRLTDRMLAIGSLREVTRLAA